MIYLFYGGLKGKVRRARSHLRDTMSGPVTIHAFSLSPRANVVWAGSNEAEVTREEEVEVGAPEFAPGTKPEKRP